MIAVGVCIGNEERFARYARASLARLNEPVRLLTRRGQSSICRAYNEFLREADRPDLEGLVLMHDDTELLDPAALDVLHDAFRDESIGVVGCAGARNVRELRWWAGDEYGTAQEPDWQHTRPGGRHDVDAVDGLLMALSPWAVRNVRFDEAFPGFHGYDVDYCFQVRGAGKRVVVDDLAVMHHSRRALDHTAFARADLRWRAKWASLRWPGIRSALVPVTLRLRQRLQLGRRVVSRDLH